MCYRSYRGAKGRNAFIIFAVNVSDYECPFDFRTSDFPGEYDVCGEVSCSQRNLLMQLHGGGDAS